jgi:hypothetical protein
MCNKGLYVVMQSTFPRQLGWTKVFQHFPQCIGKLWKNLNKILQNIPDRRLSYFPTESTVVLRVRQAWMPQIVLLHTSVLVRLNQVSTCLNHFLDYYKRFFLNIMKKPLDLNSVLNVLNFRQWKHRAHCAQSTK